jgi:hypothetical protein
MSLVVPDCTFKNNRARVREDAISSEAMRCNLICCFFEHTIGRLSVGNAVFLNIADTLLSGTITI